MPPKPKYSKDALLQTALEITRERGFEFVSARSLGKKLNATAPSVFTHFSSMDELKNTMIEEARKIYNSYIEKSFDMVLPFKGFAVQFIQFAEEEPNLFKLLFLQRNNDLSLSEYLKKNIGFYDETIAMVQKTFNITEEEAINLWLYLFPHIYGFAVLKEARACKFSEEEICEMLGSSCRAYFMILKMPKDERTKINPKTADKIYGTFESYINPFGNGLGR